MILGKRIVTAVLAVTLNCTVAYSQTAGTDVLPDDAKTIAKFDELLTVLKNLDSAAFSKIKGANAKAEELTQRLYKLSAGLAGRVDETRVGPITDGASALGTVITSASQGLKSRLLENDQSSAALNNLRDKIQELGLRKPGLVVRVLEAKFGDTFVATKMDTARWCDATAYMREKCNKASGCTLDAKYQDIVCGFNPAPSADPRDRGLFVDYQCVPSFEASFAGDYEPDSYKSSSPLLKKSRDNYVILRGNGALVCGATK